MIDKFQNHRIDIARCVHGHDRSKNESEGRKKAINQKKVISAVKSTLTKKDTPANNNDS